jgi:hypothetical protein
VKGVAAALHVPRATSVVPRAATGETKRPFTRTVVPGDDPGGFPENAKVPPAATWIGGSVTEPEHVVCRVNARIVRPLAETRNLPSEKT